MQLLLLIKRIHASYICYSICCAINVNTLIDDFRVSNRVRTDAEIQTLYQSNQPAPKDADTTLKLTFDGNLDA